MLIIMGLEGLSRAYATRYKHTHKQEHKKRAIQSLETAETLMQHSVGYPIFGLRVLKARLWLARSGVWEGLSPTNQSSLARDVKKVADDIGDSRSSKDMDDFLVEIER